MAKIVIAAYGSLGDLHPMLALACELRKRGHDIAIVTLEVYREKIDMLGFDFYPLRPDVTPEDRDFVRETMDTKSGSERIVKDLMLANIKPTYEDLIKSCEGADLLVAGEIVFAAHSVAEKTGVKLITTSLAPISMFSAFDPSVYPNAQFLRNFHFLGRPFQRVILAAMRIVIGGWLKPYKNFRSEIGLSKDHDPVLKNKYSKWLHLAMFSKAIGGPQPDWYSRTLQTGFCFYDGRQDIGKMPDGLLEFLKNGSPPIVFTLGSAAVMDARDFFEQSIKAAKSLGRRAVMLYGVFNERPKGLDEERVAFDYAPYGKIFPQAVCVVHQGGVGTTGQVLQAGVPQLIMPFSHDQPDNAFRCVKLGVARTVKRDTYTSKSAAYELRMLLSDPTYEANAIEAKSIVDRENGTSVACDAIERVLEMKK